MTDTIEVLGSIDPRFAPVRDVFIENFTRFGEVGAALSVVIAGKPVIDIWAGHADSERTRPWQHDTLVNVFSTTKGLTAMCALRLLDQGKLDVEAPVAKYWPEFAQAGKGDLPVRHLLSHAAGMAAVRRPLQPADLFDWDVMTAALAEMEPWWEPGSKHGYHALTFGWLVGEVVRRISGKSVGAFFRDEIAAPLDVDAHIGLSAEHDARVAPLIPAPIDPAQMDLLADILKDPDSLLAKAFTNPPIMPEAANMEMWRRAEIPAANGHTNARALARLYGALAGGGRSEGYTLLTSVTTQRAAQTQTGGRDAILPMHTSFGLGFMLATASECFGPNPRMFGHNGMGGSIGLADLDAQLGFGYVMNEMHSGYWIIDPRPKALSDALYACL